MDWLAYVPAVLMAAVVYYVIVLLLCGVAATIAGGGVGILWLLTTAALVAVGLVLFVGGLSLGLWGVVTLWPQA